MKETEINIILKNGMIYRVKIKADRTDMPINEFLMKYIYKDYNPNNAVNINTYDLAISNNCFNSVAININDISAIEYSGM